MRGIYSGRGGLILGGSHIIIVVKRGGGIFWEGGIDYLRVAHINWLRTWVYAGREE